MKLEYFNTDRLHYANEEGSRLDWLDDKRTNDKNALTDELNQLKLFKEGLTAADEYVRKLRDGVNNQKDILARTEQELKYSSFNLADSSWMC